MKIHIVKAKKGTFEDAVEWDVKGFISEDKAVRYMESLIEEQELEIAEAKEYIKNNSEHKYWYFPSDEESLTHCDDYCVICDNLYEYKYHTLDSDEYVRYWIEELEVEE